jgi:hypothetical protein
VLKSTAANKTLSFHLLCASSPLLAQAHQGVLDTLKFL